MTEYSLPLTITASSARQMESLGAALGRVLRRGDAVLLFGDLGAGKTTFSRGLIQHIAIDAGDVVSPTFTLVQTYDLPETTLYHYDLYRLETGDASTLTELGWEESLTEGITLVEWSERLEETYIPRDALRVHLRHNPDNSRDLTFSGDADWADRLKGLGH